MLFARIISEIERERTRAESRLDYYKNKNTELKEIKMTDLSNDDIDDIYAELESTVNLWASLIDEMNNVKRAADDYNKTLYEILDVTKDSIMILNNKSLGTGLQELAKQSVKQNYPRLLLDEKELDENEKIIKSVIEAPVSNTPMPQSPNKGGKKRTRKNKKNNKSKKRS